MKKEHDLTTMPLHKALAVIALPIIAANILHTAYTLIDTFWVGRLGPAAVASVSLSFPVLFFVLSFGIGLSMAGTILVAQYKGRKDTGQINHISAQMFLMMFGVSLALSAIGYFAAQTILEIMGAGPKVLPDSVSYLRTLFTGMPLLFVYFVFQGLMRGVGDVIVPMLIMLGSVILNAILDPIFIMGWGAIPAYGVSGAAVTTVITEGLSGIVGLLLLFSGRFNIHLKKQDFKPDFSVISGMFRLGFPASIEHSMRSITMMVMFVLVTRFGTEITAAYGMGTNLMSFVLVPSIGLALATSTLVGQNIGAGKAGRAKRVTWISAGIGFAALTFLGLLFFIFAENLAGFFVPEEKEFIAETAGFLRIMALSFGFMSVGQVMAAAIKGAGDTLASMMLTTVGLWLVLFPSAYFLSNYTDLSHKGIWWSYPITYIAVAILTMLWFVRGSWEKKRVM